MKCEAVAGDERRAEHRAGGHCEACDAAREVFGPPWAAAWCQGEEERWDADRQTRSEREVSGSSG